MNESNAPLILKAFILDTYIEHPEQSLIVKGEKSVLLSELFEQNPDMRQELISKRAEVFRKLGWEVPK